MGWVSGIAVFVMVWWVVFFAVLPWGVSSNTEPSLEEGHAYGAPKRPRLLLKIAVTSGISVLIWLAIFWVIEAELISFRDWVART
ncbi:MAG: DUF1467 family protein [Pseudomonadota bacterium]